MRTGRSRSVSRTWGDERPRSGQALRAETPVERLLGARSGGAAQQVIAERWDVLCTHLYRCRCSLARH